jgi:hypothetical protein
LYRLTGPCAISNALNASPGCIDTVSPTPQATGRKPLDHPNSPATTTSTPLIKKKKPKPKRTTKHLTSVLNAHTVQLQSKKHQQAPSPKTAKAAATKKKKKKDKNTPTGHKFNPNLEEESLRYGP